MMRQRRMAWIATCWSVEVVSQLTLRTGLSAVSVEFIVMLPREVGFISMAPTDT